MKEIDTGVKPVLQATNDYQARRKSIPAMAPMKLKAMIATIINPFMFTSANKENQNI